MNRDEFLSNIKDGHFFSVTFIKRTNGDLRKLNGRFGVVKHASPGPPPYDDSLYDLVTVWDAQKRGYRKVPVDAILEIRYNHKIWKDPNAFSSSSERILYQRAKSGLQ